jgi:hypothetical protein
MWCCPTASRTHWADQSYQISDVSHQVFAAFGAEHGVKGVGSNEVTCKYS